MGSGRALILGMIAPLAVLSAVATAAPPAAGGAGYGWPEQAAPRGLVEATYAAFHPVGGRDPGLSPEHMLVESIAGLAAQAVNDRRGDELVWVSGPYGRDYRTWHDGLVKRLDLEDRGTFDPWQLLDRFRKAGVVRGYVLYTFDASAGKPTEERRGVDESANVATSVAGVLGGVLISADLEPRARAAGLPLLMDVRGKTPAWCFGQFRGRLNPHFALAQDPRLPQNRDLAIADRMFVLWGKAEPTPAVYRWLRPGSTILGWNAGDEGQMVSQMSAYGHVLVPTNWSLNLTACAAAAADPPPPAAPPPAPPRFPALDPRTIDFADRSAAAAFLLSDGDNVQWMMGNFCHNRDYWASPDAGRFPFAFGIPAAELERAAPPVLDYLARTRPADATVVQASGGYFYPDQFGAKLPAGQRDALLAGVGRRLNGAMRRTNVRVLIVYCIDIGSPAARHAYDVLAGQLDGAVGLLAIQYSPYAGGNGAVFWTRDRNRVPVPVMTAKYAVWADTRQPNTGTPEQVAAMINAAAAKAPPGQPLLCWTIQHAWSAFPARGVAPALACAQLLGPHVRAVGIEEVLWRARMRHDPGPTRAAVRDWQP